MSEEIPQAEPVLAEKIKELSADAETSLAAFAQMLQTLLSDENRMKLSKEADLLKSAFYKKLTKEKSELGVSEEENAESPFAALEAGFKELFAKYKQERAAYNLKIEKEREENLKAKKAVIDEIKALVDAQEDVNTTFPAFRELQTKWKEIGAVPATDFRDINESYQFYVEKFYDKVQINRDMRDLDFKKNLEAKEEFCRLAEELAENPDVIEAFKELQKLHDQWKDFGPVAKEFRESVWERFKAATAVINKKYQSHFEGLKEQMNQNLESKTKLCEEVEAIAEKDIQTSAEWNQLSKDIVDIQARWRTIGFAAKKDNQAIYDRFRAACDKFFERKKAFYSDFKDSMTGNLEKKLALIAQVEALKDSTDWKKTTDTIISLQKQWKEIGAVPRKKADELWKQFRAACDVFFEQRQKNGKPENEFYANLKAKKAVIEKIKAYTPADDASAEKAKKEFAAEFAAIGFVPFKEKDAIATAFKEAMQEKFPEFGKRPSRQRNQNTPVQRAPKSEKDLLIQKYRQLQQDIDTYENNIGFFSMSKNSEAMVAQLKESIEKSKKQLKELEESIRKAEQAQE